MHTLRQSPGQAPGLCCALFRAEIKKPRAVARGLKYQIFASASDFLGLTIAARPSASRPKMTAGSIQYRPMSYRGRFSIAGTLNAHRMLAPTAPRAARADIVVCIGDNERDEDNDQCRRINDVQHWSRDRNDAVKAEIGCNGAEHTDNDDECLVGHLLAAQLGEVSCGGAGQTDGGGHAGKTHDDTEDDHAGLAEQRLNDGHNKLCAADLKAVLSRNGSAEVAQAHVNAEQQHACEDGRAGDDLELLAVGGVALGGGALEDYDAKRQRRERVHGLISGLDAAENNVVGVRGERYLAERRCQRP